MYLLNPPEYKLEDFFDGLLIGRHNNQKNKFLKDRLLSIKSPLEDAQDNYRSLGENKLLHTIPEQDIIYIPTNAKLDGSVPKTDYCG